MSENSFLLYGPQEENVPPTISLGKIIFDSLVAEDKERVALVDAHSNDNMTYGDILEGSIKVAKGFKQIGFKRNDVVSTVIENSLNCVIPVLSTLYVGATTQPINALWTPRELKHAFSISNPKWVICGESSFEKITEIIEGFDSVKGVILFESKRKGVISIEQFLKSDINIKNFEPDVLDDINEVAFIFSSSGTTGLPKGVMLTHLNIVTNTLFWRDKRYGNFQKGDVTVMPMPLYHLFGIQTLLLSIIFSVKLILIKKFNPELYLTNIETHRANKLCCPPTIAVFLAKSSLVNNYNLTSLEDIICSSAPLKQEIELSIRKRLNVQIRQMFAATETAGACTFIPNNSSKYGSCGTLLPSLIAKVCDLHTKKLLGPNKPGELCFKGSVIMKGYLNNNETTRNAFDEDGFYCSGDIGYYDEDNYFFIVGRIKELIKYKGFQVAPAELEDLLLSHSAVKDAAVIGIPDEYAVELPLAFVVKQPDKEVTEEEIKAFISERVSPEKRLRGGVRFINEIPKSPTGKILKRLLQDITENTSPIFSSYNMRERNVKDLYEPFPEKLG